MIYRTIGKTGLDASVLGIGCMRLPIVEGDSDKIDYKKGTEMIRYAIDHGVNYVDTAYPYHGGNSETFLGEALKDGYRERVILISKAPTWLLNEQEDFDKYLDEQLEKLQTDHLDIYLMHALGKDRWENLKKINVFEAIERAKASGKIKHVGFSFHDNLDQFKEIVDGYEWDLCMIQFNYMDVNEQAGTEGLNYAASKGLPVIVMEPLKGGMLASPPEDVEALWASHTDKKSPVEWALQFVANFENVKVVLSGMSSMEQLKENIEIADRLLPGSLDDEDLALVERVRATYESRVKVPCTQCKYCMPCPHGVEIPRSFTLYNRAHIFNAVDSIKEQYNASAAEAKASNCKECGLCEPQCPQKIQIIQMLKEVALEFEG
jgi:predicted aldo/keto reductase-like oxidoreductase